MKAKFPTPLFYALTILLIGSGLLWISLKPRQSRAHRQPLENTHDSFESQTKADQSVDSTNTKRELLTFEEEIEDLIKKSEFNRLAPLLQQDEQRVLKHLVALGLYHKESEDPEQRDIKIDYDIVEITTILTNHFLQKESLQAALEILETLRGADRLHGFVAVDLFQNTKSKEDAEFVWQWIRSNPDTQAATSGGSTAALLLLQHNPDQAWEKSLQLPQGHTRQTALNALVYEIANTNITEAIELLNSVRDLKDSDTAIAHLLKQAIDQNHTHIDLFQIANSTTDDHLKTINLHEVIMDWAKTDSEDLIAWYKEKLPNWSYDEQLKFYDIVDNALIQAKHSKQLLSKP